MSRLPRNVAKFKDQTRRHHGLPGLIPPYDDKVRIYTVVARTVQSPVEFSDEGFPRFTALTKTIVQPTGRMTAQHGHSCSKVRAYMAIRLMSMEAPVAQDDYCAPITTIVKECRDSLELAHIRDLLAEAEIEYEYFLDTNPEYGEGEVMTSISTWPVYAKNISGIMDYLPLFDDKKG